MAYKGRYKGGNTSTLSVSNPLDRVGHSISMVQHHALQTLKHTGNIFKHTFDGLMKHLNNATRKTPVSGGKTKRRRRRVR